MHKVYGTDFLLFFFWTKGTSFQSLHLLVRECKFCMFPALSSRLCVCVCVCRRVWERQVHSSTTQASVYVILLYTTFLTFYIYQPLQQATHLYSHSLSLPKFQTHYFFPLSSFIFYSHFYPVLEKQVIHSYGFSLYLNIFTFCTRDKSFSKGIHSRKTKKTF